MRDSKPYTAYNAEAIDAWVRDGWEWGIPLSHEDYLKAKAGELKVLLTPTVQVPKAWFGNLSGKRVLGLASGGGQQMPVFAAHGAICTVMDLSDAQLASEALVAKREGYEIEIVKADMTCRFPFPDAQFDLIFHPVSNCYVREVQPIWEECFRVLKPYGTLLSGLDNGMNFLFDEDSLEIRHKLPYDALAEKDWEDKVKANNDSLQFSHTIMEQVGGQLKAGFRLMDIYEDTNGSGLLHDYGVPCFYATWAQKPMEGERK